MKNFEFGTSEYWSNEAEKARAKLSIMCKGFLCEASEIINNSERYNRENNSAYVNICAMCEAIMDAEDEYDRYRSMLKDAQERERAQQNAEQNEEPNGEEDR